MSICQPIKPRSIAWNIPWNTRKSVHAKRKPDGGFCFIPAMALLRAWRAYKGGIIRLYDLRVWFACFEAVARRCNVDPNRSPRFTKEEIHRLVGGRDSNNVATAFRRLSKAGLLIWSQTRIRFLNPKGGDGESQDQELQRMIDLVTNHRRKVPVPRRTIRMLASNSRPVAIATILGHLLRCLYYRNGKCEPCGRCKSSWVADVFGVDIRNVKAARLNLDEIGWLMVEKSPQLALNRWGAAVTIQLTWKPVRQPPPPNRNSPTGSPPPKRYRELSSRIDNQNPTVAARTGACLPTRPSLRHVRNDDLRDVRSVDVLLEEAWQLRLLPRGDAARLRFHSAAAHALRVGQRNPAGLFAVFIRRGLWSYLSGVDEDAARQRLAATHVSAPRTPHCSITCSMPTSHPVPARAVLERLLPRLSEANEDGGANESIGFQGAAGVAIRLVACRLKPSSSGPRRVGTQDARLRQAV